MSTERKKRILLIEDTAQTRELVTLMLQNAGYEVEAAEDAVEAGKLLLKTRPNLIIADIQMPYMSGDEFIAALRTEPSMKDIPVVFLSSDERLGEHAKNVGAVAYFDKRGSMVKLLEVVEMYTQR